MEARSHEVARRCTLQMRSTGEYTHRAAALTTRRSSALIAMMAPIALTQFWNGGGHDRRQRRIPQEVLVLRHFEQLTGLTRERRWPSWFSGRDSETRRSTCWKGRSWTYVRCKARETYGCCCQSGSRRWLTGFESSASPNARKRSRAGLALWVGAPQGSNPAVSTAGVSLSNGTGLTCRFDVQHAAERHPNRSHAGAWERGFLVTGRQTSSSGS
jgi:hypothetical protein